MASLDDILKALASLQQDIATIAKTAALATKVTQIQSRNVNPIQPEHFPSAAGVSPGSPNRTPLSSAHSISVSIPPNIPLATPDRFTGNPNKI